MSARAENKLHPLEIEDARKAAHRASELQREVEDAIRNASRDLAEKERLYREALSQEILRLHGNDVAWTTCGDVARGEKTVAQRRYERDVAAGVFEAMRQQAYRRGADRKDVDTLLNWSMRRDLRVDTPPVGEQQESAIGSGRGLRAAS